MKKSKGSIQISEGRTGDFVIHAFFCIVIGGITCVWIWPIGLVIVLFSLPLFIASSGFEFDESRKITWTYKEILGFRVRKKIDIGLPVSGQLVFEKEGPTIQGRFGGEAGAVRFFELIFLYPEGKERSIHTFTSYKSAREVIQILAGIYNIRIQDALAERIKDSLKRPRR